MIGLDEYKCHSLNFMTSSWADLIVLTNIIAQDQKPDRREGNPKKNKQSLLNLRNFVANLALSRQCTFWGAGGTKTF